jgi:hypothetical protein
MCQKKTLDFCAHQLKFWMDLVVLMKYMVLMQGAEWHKVEAHLRHCMICTKIRK